MSNGSLADQVKADLAKKAGVAVVKPTPQSLSLDSRTKDLQKLQQKLDSKITQEQVEFRKADVKNVNFSMYDKKLEKLQSYGSKYQKYGYNPYINNEKFYDDMTTSGEQWMRSLKGAGKLMSIGFTDNALFGAVAGKDSHKEYAKAVDFYTSKKGGTAGFMQNLVLNSGYTVGIMADMAIEELAMAGLTMLTLGGASEVTIPAMAAKAGQSMKNIKGAYNMYSNLNKIIKTANKVDNLNPALKALNFVNPLSGTTNFIKTLKNAESLKDVSKTALAVKGTGLLFRDAKLNYLAYSEANLEGNMLKDEMYDEFVKNHKGALSVEDAEKYKRLSESASYATKVENMFVIGATNKLVFDNMFKAFDDLKGLGKVLGENRFYSLVKPKAGQAKVVRNGFRGVAERTKMTFADGFGKGVLRTAKNVGSKSGKYLSANIGEGIQENLQEAVATKNKHMYGSAEHGDYFESVLEGLKSQFTGQGMETFLSGFLMGGVISPITSSVKTLQSIKEGRAFDYFKDREGYKKTKEAEFNRLESDAKLINEMFQDAGDVFNGKGRAIAEQAELEAEMVDAAGQGDKHRFQNAKDKSYRSHLHVAMKYGMMDQFKEHLSEMKTMDAQQFKEAFPSTDINMTKAQRDMMIDRKIYKAEKFEDHYKNVMKNVINPVPLSQLDVSDPNYQSAKTYYDYFERAKEELIFNKSEFEDNLDRKQSILEGIREQAPEVPFNDYQKLFNTASLNGEIGMLRDEVKALDYAENDDAGKKLVAEKKSRLNALERYSDSLSEMKTIASEISDLETIDDDEITPAEKKDLKRLKKQYDQVSKDIFNSHKDYLKILSPRMKDVALENFSQKSFEALHDYYKLEQKNDELDRAVNVLTNPNMLHEHVQRQVEMHSVMMAQFKKYVKNSLAMSRNKEVIQNGLNELFSKGIGFPMNRLDEFTEKGVLPPVLYDLETGAILSPIVSKKKNSKIEKNPKFEEGISILKETYDKLHGVPAKLKDASKEDVLEAIGEQADEAIEAAEQAGANISNEEKKTLKEQYVPTDEDDQAVKPTDPLESYPKILINELIDEYREQVANEDFMDPEIGTLTPEVFTKRFRSWVKDSGEKIINQHNERVAPIPNTFELLSPQEKSAMLELGYDDPEQIDKMSMQQVRSILNGEEEVVETEEDETEIEVEDKSEREKAIEEIQYVAADMDYYSTPLTDKKFNSREEAEIFVNDYFDKAEVEEETETPLEEEVEEGDDANTRYKKSLAQNAIEDAVEMFTPIEGETDYYNKVMAVEQFIVGRIGEEIDGITITEGLIREVYKELKNTPDISQELVYESSVRAEKIVYDYVNQDAVEEKLKNQKEVYNALKVLGYTKKDIESFSDEAKASLIKNNTSKLEYLESLKSVTAKELDKIKELFESLDTNVRTEEELQNVINTIALENQELFDQHENSVFLHTQSIRMGLATLKDFSSLKKGDVVKMKDGSFKKVEKVTKSKVKLVNYNSIVRDQIEMSKAEFKEEAPLIINEFNKKMIPGIKSELEKQNVDDLSNLLRTFTTGALTVSDDYTATEEDLKEHFKLCK